jgi:uncharacterized protein YyaL (SSP411 family)
MMAAEEPQSKSLASLLAQHRELRSLLETIDRALEERTATVEEVAQMLGQLGDRLVKHFALEEEGGYFTEALLHAPQLVARANALLAQHPRIRSRAVEIALEVRTRQALEGDWWEQTQSRFHALRDELLRHETHENGLLQEAYTRDLGSHD